MLFDEIRRRDGDELDRLRSDPTHHRAPGGESPAEVLARVRAVLAKIARDHPAERVAIVSHGLALAAIKVHLLGLPLDVVWDHEPANATPEEYDLEAR
jgi:probable phosphoglycerate mutase